MKRFFVVALTLVLFLCALSAPALADKLPASFVPEALKYYFNEYLKHFIQEEIPEEEQESWIQAFSLEYMGTFENAAYYDNYDQTVEMVCYYSDGNVKTNQSPDAINFVVFNELPENLVEMMKLLYSWTMYNAKDDEELLTAWQWREGTTENNATFAMDGYALYCIGNEEFESMLLIAGS